MGPGVCAGALAFIGVPMPVDMGLEERRASSPPPMLMTLVLAPPGPIWPCEGLTDLPWSMLGFWKYSKIAARSSLVTEGISHMTMKKAIIGVTKSAYATFHAPP